MCCVCLALILIVHQKAKQQFELFSGVTDQEGAGTANQPIPYTLTPLFRFTENKIRSRLLKKDGKEMIVVWLLDYNDSSLSIRSGTCTTAFGVSKLARTEIVQILNNFGFNSFLNIHIYIHPKNLNLQNELGFNEPLWTVGV